MPLTLSTSPSCCALVSRHSASILPHRRQQRKNRFLLPRPSFATPQHCPNTTLDNTASSCCETEASIQEELPPIQLPPVTSQLVQYAPFPRCSINLISCSSNSGKTRFLTNIVAHRANFFQDFDLIQRVVYCNGNRRDHSLEHPWANAASDSDKVRGIDLPVVSLSLEDFTELGSTLRANDIVILDDILQLTDEIQFLVKYGAHHFNLHLFLVTQTCLSSPLYSLIQSTHNLILLFGNTATTRLAQHLVQSFFLCSETKAYLKAIFGIAEKQQDVVVLKLNGVASYRPHSDVLALARVQGLFEEDPPYCFVYPELGRADKLESPEKLDMEADMPELKGAFLDEAFVLIPAHRVRQKLNASTDVHSDDDEGDDCLKEKRKHWNDMAIFLEKEIENSFPLKRWTAAKNLTRELLRCNDLCVSADYRTVFVRQRPKWKFGIVDFLNVATRKSGPQEAASPKVLMYRPLVNILLRHDTPETFIVNKLLLAKTGANAPDVLSNKDHRFFFGRGPRRKKHKKQRQMPYEFY